MTDTPRNRPGLRWHKVDLHVHTPASKDWASPAINPDELVARAQSKGLSAIAITDHNSGEWIDRLIVAARGTGLTVFPGVEVSVTGGKHGVHIIALFDCDATTKTVENLLSKLGFSAADYGNLEAISELGPEAVVDKIYEAGGLPILAHADSSKGVLADMQGQQRANVMNSPFLAAVEITSVAKSARFCSGKDPSYRRKLAYYRASDNPVIHAHGHSVEGIGHRFSWFKSDGLSLDALKQVFNDPDQRIKCDEETAAMPEQMYPRIVTLEASGGFLSGLSFGFHEGLNSIIGGKGVGKSLLIEFLRFALDQPSSITDLRTDMAGKLTKQLGLGGQVRVRVQLAVDQTISVARTFDGHKNPITATYDSSGKQVAGDIAQLFPILAYSQTETIEISKDNGAQLRLIDSFLDLATTESRIATLAEALTKSDLDIAEAEASLEKRDNAITALATHDEKVVALERALKSKELDALNKLKPKSKCMTDVEAFTEDLEGAIDGLSEALKKCAPPKLPSSLESDKELAKLLGELSQSARQLQTGAKKLEADVAEVVRRTRGATAAWDKIFAKKTAEHKAFVLTQGGERPTLLARKSALDDQRPDLQKKVTSLQQRIDALPGLRAARAKLIASLDAEIDNRHAMRNEKYRELTAASSGRLDLQLVKGGRRASYVAVLLRLKTGSRLQDSTVEQICEKVDPRKLLSMVVRKDVEGLVKAAHIHTASATALIEHLNATNNVTSVLALEHSELLEDRPEIRFRKDDGKYYELTELSVGQKCTALLIIALADGSRPVVIDQPEDALDITSVYEDVTLQLRSRKHSRQFILTTHNPTVAVAGDSDQFHVLKATATRAVVTNEGAIDRKDVRDEVIQHLEGGPEPFGIKSRKYGLSVK
jgi:predicted ATP-dependent endonuclease of OLD family